MFTNNGETSRKARRRTRKQVKGILTQNERESMQGKGNYSRDSVKHYRSNIIQKTKKAIEDLDLIFKTYEAWDIFVDDKPDVRRLIEKAVEYQYDKNYSTEFRKRLKEKVKRKVNMKIISQKTKEQIDEIVISALKRLQTKP